MKFPHIRIYPARILFAALTIACMVCIFCFSMDNASKSSGKSGKVTKAAVETFVKDYKEMPPSKQTSILDKAEHIVRKMAHFSIYTLLGFLASLTVGRRKLFSRKSLGVIVFCFLYACSDEIHQIFVPGRAGMFTDVLIDTSGALTGMIISMAVMRLYFLIKNRREAKRAAA